MELRVWRYLNCKAAGDCSIIIEASLKQDEYKKSVKIMNTKWNMKKNLRHGWELLMQNAQYKIQERNLDTKLDIEQMYDMPESFGSPHLSISSDYLEKKHF